MEASRIAFLAFMLTGGCNAATDAATSTRIIRAYAGNNDSAQVGSAVAVTPSVRITDAHGNPVANVAVTFVVTSGGGSAAATSAKTNNLGIATMGTWTLGPNSNTVLATADSVTGSPITFNATGFMPQGVTVATNANCAVLAGAAYCWGSNAEEQYGNGTTSSSAVPVPAGGALVFQTLVTGVDFTCGLTTNGIVYCWGLADGGSDLGNGSQGGSASPVAIAGGLRFQSIAAGEAYACGLTTQSAAYCWGVGREGELGNGDSMATNPAPFTSLVPVAVSGGLTFQSLALGDFHSCGLTRAGAAYCWGDNTNGVLGVGSASASVLTPLPVVGGLTFQGLTAGHGFTCGLTPAGAAYCWGYNGFGILSPYPGGGIGQGPNGPGYYTAPFAVRGGLTFQSLAAGLFSMCGLTASNAAYCWGLNERGQGGNLTTTDYSVPVAVSGGLTFVSLAPGFTKTCGVATTGGLYCWGDLVGGSTPPALSPILVPLPAIQRR